MNEFLVMFVVMSEKGEIVNKLGWVVAAVVGLWVRCLGLSNYGFIVVLGRPVCWYGGHVGDRLLPHSPPSPTATNDGEGQYPTGLASVGRGPG